MKRIAFILFMLLSALAISQEGEVIQEITVIGWRDGIVTSSPDEFRPQNSAEDIQNYVFTRNAFLSGPRPGFKLMNPTDTSTDSSDVIQALFGYFKGPSQELLAVMTNSATAAPAGVYQIVRLDTNFLVETELFPYAYRDSTNFSVLNSHWGIAHEDSIVYIANRKTPFLTYDGNKIYPMRPLGPGQPAATPKGSADIDGGVRYKILYIHTVTRDKTTLSSPSFITHPSNEGVWVYNITRPLDETKFDVHLYRTRAGESLDSFYFVDSLLTGDDTTYYDTFSNASLGAAPTVPYGFNDHGVTFGVLSTAGTQDTLFPPGAPWPFIDSTATLLEVTIVRGDANHTGDFIAYYVVFVDSNGYWSLPSAPALMIDTLLAGADITRRVILDSLPLLPTVNSNIKTAYLLRKHQASQTTNRTTGSNDRWEFFDGTPGPPADTPFHSFVGEIFLVDSIAQQSYVDSGFYVIAGFRRDENPPIQWTFGGIGEFYRGFSGQSFDTNTTLPAGDSNIVFDSSLIFYFPESLQVVDSSARFNPGTIAIYGGRLYASSDIESPNNLFYSLVGKRTSFPATKVINFPTGDGDIINSLSDVEDGLFFTKQSNVTSLRGFRFLDFKADEIFKDIGATSPNFAVAKDRSFVFVTTEGALALSLSGGVQNLSVQIQDQFDSLGYWRMRRSVGQYVNEDLWVSVPSRSDDSVTNDKVYVRDSRTGGWTTITGFGFQSATRFDYRNAAEDRRSERYVFGSAFRKLHRLNYDITDTLDNITDTVLTLVQTRFHLAQFPGRKKVHYLDLFGDGSIDSLKLTVLGNKTANTYDTLETIFTSIDFDADGRRQRIYIDQLAQNAAFRIESFTGSRHILEGYVVGFTNWDLRNENQ